MEVGVPEPEVEDELVESVVVDEDAFFEPVSERSASFVDPNVPAERLSVL